MDRAGFTPLHLAATREFPARGAATIRRCLRAGCDPFQLTVSGDNVLGTFWSLDESGWIEKEDIDGLLRLSKALLEAGVDPYAPNRDGLSAADKMNMVLENPINTCLVRYADKFRQQLTQFHASLLETATLIPASRLARRTL